MEFTAFPDCPAGAALAAEIGAAHRIDHPSGRPWLLGDWHTDEIAVVDAGTRRLVVLGHTLPDRLPTAHALVSMRSLHDVDALAARLPGLVHLAVSMSGSVRIQGSVSGARQVFTAVRDGTTVAASGVGPLVRLTTPELDEAVLAARLLASGGAPWPLSQRPVHRGIVPLTTGHWLKLNAAGRGEQVPWWNLPDESLSLAEGADAVRTALSEAVAARVRPGTTLSADLSGGLDSTSLCFVAAEAGADLVTYHVAPLDAANPDTAWARRAATYLRQARHHVLAADRPENLFDVGYTAQRRNAAPEGPAIWASGLAHVHDLADRAAAEGATAHLTGLGGDELFGRTAVCAWSLARAHPVRSIGLLNRYRLANRWSLAPMIRALADRSSFAASLAAAADRIGAPQPLWNEPSFGWVPRIRMPSWVTRDAVAAVRDLLKTTAREAPEPLDADRTRHHALASIVFEGTTIRQLNTALSGKGTRWDAPLLDDRVVAAALSTRIDQRLASGRFKPLLTHALRDIVPGDILERRDKGEFSAEVYQGVERNQERILDLCEDSHLARLGLVDASAFRAAVLDPGPMSRHLQPITTTVACESWLRSHDRPHVQTMGAHE